MTHARPSRPDWLRPLIPALAALAPALALYLLTAPWPDTPDGMFHLHRVRALAEALRMGMLYPRWFPDFAYGYGYPVLNFYAPLFYYPPALLHLTGLDLITAVRVSLAAWYGLSGLAAYALLRCWTRPLPAALGALLYLAYPYRLYDLFVRGALPEFAAFIWPPLIAWATLRCLAQPTYQAIKKSVILERNLAREFPGSRLTTQRQSQQNPGDRAASLWEASLRNPRDPSLVLSRHCRCVIDPLRVTGKAIVLKTGTITLAALAWAGLIVTHNLTALMAALAGVGALALWAGIVLLRRARGNQGQSLLAPIIALALPLALGAGLSATYALPALAEAGWVGLSAGGDARGYAAHFAGLPALFDPSLVYRYPDAAQPTVPAPGYAAVVLIAAALALLLPQARGRRAGLGISAGVALAALWLNTGSSAFVWNALAPALGKLQFPWRWQTVVALALACVLAWLLEIGGRWLAALGRPTFTRPLARSITAVLAIYLALNASGGLAVSPASFAAADLTPAQMWDFDAAHGQVGASWTGEFLPRWVTEQRWAIGQSPSGAAAEAQPATSGIRSVRVLAQSYLGERLSYTAFAPGQLVFHTFYYPAWRIEVDGRAAKTRAVGDLGLLAVDLPAGEHEVTRHWGATPTVWAGRSLSAAAWFTILTLLALKRDRWRLLRIGLWLAIAIFVLIVGSGWLVRQQAAIQIGADFGPVRLEAAVAEPAQAGKAVAVTLSWLVTGVPEPLTAFVHVLAPDGRMVAGHDAPLAGVYTPPERWQPGELLPDHHVFPRPADLPAGIYQLRAGVYRPGAADTPLIPAGRGSDDPRVDVGTLEVRP